MYILYMYIGPYKSYIWLDWNCGTGPSLNKSELWASMLKVVYTGVVPGLEHSRGP